MAKDKERPGRPGLLQKHIWHIWQRTRKGSAEARCAFGRNTLYNVHCTYIVVQTFIRPDRAVRTVVHLAKAKERPAVLEPV